MHDRHKGGDKHYIYGCLGTSDVTAVKKTVNSFYSEGTFLWEQFLNTINNSEGCPWVFLKEERAEDIPKKAQRTRAKTALALSPLQVIFSSALGVSTSCSAAGCSLTRPKSQVPFLSNLWCFHLSGRVRQCAVIQCDHYNHPISITISSRRSMCTSSLVMLLLVDVLLY